MIDFIDAYEARSEFEHVVTEGDDDKLRVFGALLDVGGYDGNLKGC